MAEDLPLALLSQPMFPKLPTIVVIALALCAAGTKARAQDESAQPSSSPFRELHPFRLFLGVYVGPAWLNADKAAELAYADSAVKFSLSVGATVLDLVSASISWGAALPPDHGTYMQSGLESEVDMPELAFAIGPRTPYLCVDGAPRSTCLTVMLFGNVGYSWVDTYRSISLPENTYCTDCEAEDLGDEWAAVLEIGAGVGWPSRGAIGIEFQPIWRFHPGSSFLNHDLQVGLVITAL